MDDTPAPASAPTPRPDETGCGLSRLLVAPAELGTHDAVAARIDTLVGDRSAEGARQDVLDCLAEAMHQARAQVHAALLAHPLAGLKAARAYTHATDLAVRGAWHYCTGHLHPAPIRTQGEQLSIVGVGGYGRGEMAPFSDVDLLFLVPYKRTAWAESVVESMLYLLWDLKLKVGQATVRSTNASASAGPISRSVPTCSKSACSAATRHRSKRWTIGFGTSCSRAPGTSLSRRRLPSATGAMNAMAAHATCSNPTSRRARGACAICRRCTGFRNTSTTP